MKKIAINTEIGGFSVTKEIAEYLANLGYKQAIDDIDFHDRYCKSMILEYDFSDYQVVESSLKYGYMYERDYPPLIEAIEKFGCPDVKIVEIPDDVEWYIDESESGIEWIAEKHRTWD